MGDGGFFCSPQDTVGTVKYQLYSIVRVAVSLARVPHVLPIFPFETSRFIIEAH